MNQRSVSRPAIEAFDLTKIYGSGNKEVLAMKAVSLRVWPANRSFRSREQEVQAGLCGGARLSV